jgi:cytochrome P450
VSRSAVGDGYAIINKYADVRRCAMDWRTFSSADGWQLNAPEGALPILPEDSDPPYHNTWQQVLNPPFTRNAVATLDAFARQRTGELLEGFKGAGQCEFVADFAAHLPGQVLFEKILPVPEEDLGTLFADIDTFSFGELEERGEAFARGMPISMRS